MEGKDKVRSYGVIPISKENDSIKILVIQHKSGGHWSFPKGRPEKQETEIETAKRELNEETGLTLKNFFYENGTETIMASYIEYEYEYKGKMKSKRVDFYVGEVEGVVKLQKSELKDSKWMGLSEVENQLTFNEEKTMWKKVREQLESLNKV